MSGDPPAGFQLPDFAEALGPHTQLVALDGGSEAFVRRTSFFVNMEWELGSTADQGKNILGQMYVESLEPLIKTQPFPIILIHGDFHTGQIWLTKPDGNPGWASYFSKQGYHVYVVDLPPFGRSNYINNPSLLRDSCTVPNLRDACFVERELTAPGKRPVKQQAYPNAKLHDKWPGTGKRGDPIFTKYCASLVSLPIHRPERQTLAQNGLQELLKVTGKAILIGHGAGATAAWLATDVQSELVHSVVAIEPAGPPCGTALDKDKPANLRAFSTNIQHDLNTRNYGLTDIPITYDPPANLDFNFAQDFAAALLPLELRQVKRTDGKGTCVMQKEFPAGQQGQSGSPRQLLHLAKVQHALVTAHASFHSTFDWATIEFMRQAGVTVEWLKLDQMGILGNGHLMFLETNSDEVAAMVDTWIRGKTGTLFGVSATNTAAAATVAASNDMCMPDPYSDDVVPTAQFAKQTLQETVAEAEPDAARSFREEAEDGAEGEEAQTVDSPRTLGSESMDTEDSDEE